MQRALMAITTLVLDRQVRQYGIPFSVAMSLVLLAVLCTPKRILCCTEKECKQVPLIALQSCCQLVFACFAVN